MKNKGLLIVFSGPSGSGKGTILKEVLKANPSVRLSVSATTRAPRNGEEDGVHYFFVGAEQFEQMIQNDEMIEYARYCDYFYGTPKRPVEQALAAGNDVVLEIDLQGALHVKQLYPDCVMIFVAPPSKEVLERRLRERNTEQEEAILKRLAQAEEELRSIEKYDYVVVNDKLEDAVADLKAIVRAEHCRVLRSGRV